MVIPWEVPYLTGHHRMVLSHYRGHSICCAILSAPSPCPLAFQFRWNNESLISFIPNVQCHPLFVCIKTSHTSESSFFIKLTSMTPLECGICFLLGPGLMHGGFFFLLSRNFSLTTTSQPAHISSHSSLTGRSACVCHICTWRDQRHHDRNSFRYLYCRVYDKNKDIPPLCKWNKPGTER